MGTAFPRAATSIGSFTSDLQTTHRALHVLVNARPSRQRPVTWSENRAWQQASGMPAIWPKIHCVVITWFWDCMASTLQQCTQARKPSILLLEACASRSTRRGLFAVRYGMCVTYAHTDLAHAYTAHSSIRQNMTNPNIHLNGSFMSACALQVDHHGPPPTCKVCKRQGQLKSKHTCCQNQVCEQRPPQSRSWSTNCSGY